MVVRGTQGYGDDAEEFIRRSESIPFASKHRAFIHLVPTEPCTILDIGAGSGADAAGLASLGHRVLAVEPTEKLRLAGMELHASDQIEWDDDSLPLLPRTVTRRETFDIVLIHAVWMHLDAEERARAMPVVASLMRPGGVLLLSLRHGQVPAGRLMFEVSGEETIRLAQAAGLRMMVNIEAESIQTWNRQAGVTWTHLAFQR
ncbi:MAG: methyltransferase domain-containing protein [Fimbriimonas sp.]